MGADMADINNDGFSEIFVTDMLPQPDERIKTVTTFDSWDGHQNIKTMVIGISTRETLYS